MAPARAAFWIPADPTAGPQVFHFVDVQATELITRVLGSYDRKELARRVDHNRGGLFNPIPIRVKLGPVTLFLALGKDFLILPKGSKRSEKSGAKYLAEWEQGDHGVLVQLLPRGRTTSCHAHSGKLEVFHRIHGSPVVKLGLGDGVVEQKLRISLAVPSLTFHQLSATDGPTLTLIEVFGRDPLRMTDYIRP